MSVTEPPFHRIAIVGLGLIGGSIALAVRERWPSTHVVGVDRAAGAREAVARRRDRRAATTSPAVGRRRPDRPGGAGPPERRRCCAQVAARVAPDAVVTDVGGTKRDIVDAARGAAEPRDVRRRPSDRRRRARRLRVRDGRHLFARRPWIFTPDGDDAGQRRSSGSSASRRGLGRTPATMAAAEHDRLMAFLSHLPQLAASALMEVVGSAATETGLPLAGRGLVDTTRLASSPARRLARHLRDQCRRDRRRARSADRAPDGAARRSRARRAPSTPSSTMPGAGAPS